MTIEEARIGTRVMSLVEFSGVPIHTQGIIDEDYDTGVMVAWNLSDGSPLRDGFDKETDLKYLTVL